MSIRPDSVAAIATFVHNIKKQKRALFRVYVFTLGIFAIPVVYDAIVPDSSVKDSYYTFVAVFLLANVVKEILRERIFQVSFDPGNQKISIVSKTFISKPKKKVIAFNHASLEYIDEGSFWIFKGSIKLCFLSHKTEVACIKERSSGFNELELKEMVSSAEYSGIPVAIIK